jgi:hypothetical protein
MERMHLRELHMPWFAVVFAVIALTLAALAPVAGASSPSQDQYGSALPGVGGNSNGSPGSSSASGTGETTIPVTGEESSSQSTGSDASSGTEGTSSGSGSKKSASRDEATSSGKAVNDSSQSPIGAENASHSVPQIAADSAGDSWVPFFIAGLVALGAAGAFLVYRNRRRTAQP